MEKYNVTGMSCAACAARVEKAAKSVDGVTSCAVNLLTNSMIIEGDANPALIIKAIEAAGYGAEKVKAGEDHANLKKSLKQTETPHLVKRLIFSGIFLLILMYFSMGVHMLGWPVPWTKGQNDGRIIGIIEAVFALVVMIINRKFFRNGIKGVFHGGPNMDTLVAMGSGVSYIYSLVVFIKYIVRGDSINQGLPHLYFESAAMILTLITIGKLLESISKGRTTDAIKGLMEMAPKTALVPVEGTKGLKTVPVEEVNIGDIFIVEPGMSVPVDGIVLSGEAKMDESALTGESELILKKEKDEVSTPTINTDGTIVCTETKTAEDTTLSQIIKLVSEASATKAPIARIADKVSAVFVPVVIGIAVLTFIIWMLIGGTSEVVLTSGSSLLAFALSRGISVLVISCPCALGLATPVAIMVGSGVGSRKGILFKTAAVLEQTGKPGIIVLDKTGTITTGEVGSDVPKEDSKEGIRQLENLGLQVVMLSGDKIGRARKIAAQVGIRHIVAGVLPGGKGMVVKALQKPYEIGSAKSEGLLMTVPEKIVRAGYKNQVIMCGDGINDAPALKTAEIGMAIGAGKDIAIDAANVVLMNSSILDIAAAIRLSRRTLLNIKENLFWAFIYNIICIPLAAGVYTGIFGWAMSPMVGAAAMALSSFCVVMNALRLNLYNPYKEGKPKAMISADIGEFVEQINEELKNNTKQTEGQKMERTINVGGMMCQHCEKRVKGALEKLPEVAEAFPDHEKNIVVLKLNSEISDEILKGVIEGEGYDFL
ncbi:MAG: HAD-IC family P-type ATPase [Lachnospiraceae bacterium]|nr:HAD-IC family P-type ATPase [Lachnospiraceae bacterium]